MSTNLQRLGVMPPAPKPLPAPPKPVITTPLVPTHSNAAVIGSLGVIPFPHDKKGKAKNEESLSLIDKETTRCCCSVQ